MRFLVVCAFALGSYVVSAASAYWTGLMVGNGGYSGDSSQVAGYSIQGTVYSGDGAYATINATMEGYVVEGSAGGFGDRAHDWRFEATRGKSRRTGKNGGTRNFKFKPSEDLPVVT